MSKWVAALTRILRDNVTFDDTGPVRVDRDAADYCHLLKVAADIVRDAESGLDLAWVIEPHESGYPHLHFVTTARWIDAQWMREVWSKILQSDVRWSKHKVIRHPDGVCRYLTKYVTKGQLPPDLLALMYRKRLYACTLPVDPNVPVWSEETPEESSTAALDVSFPPQWGAGTGWRVELSAPGQYAFWRRVVSWSELASHLPLHTADAWQHSPLWLRALWPGYVHDHKKRARLGKVHSDFYVCDEWIKPIDIVCDTR